MNYYSFWFVHYYMNTKALLWTRWAWWAGYSCQENMQMRDNSFPCYGLSLNFPELLFLCSWGICIINSQALPHYSPIYCSFFLCIWLFALYNYLFMHNYCMYACVCLIVLHDWLWLRADRAYISYLKFIAVEGHRALFIVFTLLS